VYLTGLRILLVKDEPSTREGTCALLELAEHSCRRWVGYCRAEAYMLQRQVSSLAISVCPERMDTRCCSRSVLWNGSMGVRACRRCIDRICGEDDHHRRSKPDTTLTLPSPLIPTGSWSASHSLPGEERAEVAQARLHRDICRKPSCPSLFRQCKLCREMFTRPGQYPGHPARILLRGLTFRFNLSETNMLQLGWKAGRSSIHR